MRSIMIDAMIVGGLAAQAVGLYLELGAGWASVIVGSELVVIGLMGVKQ